MKKLFSIVLVIAMAVSCLAIFPAASIEGISTFSHEISGDIVTFTFYGKVKAVIPEGVTPIYDTYFEDEALALEFLGAETITATNMSNLIHGDQIFIDIEEGYSSLGGKLQWITDRAAGDLETEVTWQFRIVGAEPGDTITLTACEMYIGCYSIEQWVEFDNGEYAFVYEDTAGEETEDTTTETKPVEPELPEAPAAAEFQTLAGCEVCGTAAGVRFIATVDAAADAFGMYISANGTTKKLSSTDAGFKVKAETADTITFTAVIFSDLTFTVEVFEVYGETEVKSVAGTN